MQVEFTGERVIPGRVDADLLNEHMARYAFAARLARGKRVLDAGCGAGYGAAELAKSAQCVVGADASAEAVVFAREHYRLPYLQFEQASCIALQMGHSPGEIYGFLRLPCRVEVNARLAPTEIAEHRVG